MYQKVIIGSTERGILLKNKQFERILGPGKYRFFSLSEKYVVQVVDIIQSPQLEGNLARFLIEQYSSEVESFLLKVSMGPREIGILYRSSKAELLISPGETRLFWKGLSDISVKRFDISNEFQIENETLKDLSLLQNEKEVLTVRVPEHSRGILFDAGVIVRELTPGFYGFYRAQRNLTVSVLDTRVTALEVGGQEMLTKDKVSLRVNLTVAYSMSDVSRAVRSVSDIPGEIYRTAQLSLRQAVGEKTLDQLLENKESLNRDLAGEISGGVERYGIRLERVGVKDIILPGDMRVLLNQVVEAEKAAEAQNIRRREETAQTRSLLNTAKMLENNPTLLRLKELEALERISGKIEKLTVFDGMKGIMNGLVNLQEK